MSAPKLALAVAFLGLLIYLPGLNRETGVTGKDEYLLSLRTPMEMIEQGAYLTPYLDHQPRFKKPPLIYWLILLNYKIFGVTLLSARIWGVLSGIGLAVVTGLIARLLWKEQSSGLAPAWVALSSAGVFVQARMALLDLPLAFFVTLSIYLFMLWKEKGQRIWLLASAGACGLSVMVKGPVGPLLAGSAIALNLILLGGIRGRPKQWKDWLWAGGVFVLVAVPWPLAMLLIWKEAFVAELTNELVTSRLAGYSTGPSAVLGGMLLLLLPWSFHYLGALGRVLRRGLERENRNALWLVAWSLASSLPFLLLRLKFERYLLAAIPPAAILVCLVPYRNLLWKGIVFKGTAILYALVGLILLAFGFWFQVTPLWIVLLLLVVLAGFCVLIWKEKKLTTAAAVIGVYHMLLFGVLYPGIGIHATPPELMAMVQGDANPVYYYKGDHPGFLSMRLGRSVQRVKHEAQLVDLAQRGSFLIVEEKLEGDLRQTARRAGLTVPGPSMEFGMFYSRVAWIRFPREGTTWEDWKEAIRERSLQGLKTRFRVYFLRDLI